jgi:D-alanine-D-alanine ligase
MRVLVLHSDVPPNARPDEQDTLMQAVAVAAALARDGHEVSRAAFVPDPASLREAVERTRAEALFNLVECVWGRSAYASFAAQMLADTGVPFTGARSGTIAATCDKVLAKRLLTGAHLPTALWSEPPEWRGLDGSERWIVKAADEDASLGLDDGAVVSTREEADARARDCAKRFGGHWFAEVFVEGREFNIAIVERGGAPYVFPIGEMVFEKWDESRPRIIGYAAKWDAATHDYNHTLRVFDWQEKETGLRKTLEHLARECWALFGCHGYARVDIRLDAEHRPHILEINANPCLEPDAGFAAAARQANLSYDQLIGQILHVAH